MSKNKKKLGYNQYERLLTEAHQKLEMLAHKVHELQTYFIAYVEYRGDNLQFNEWMNKRIKEMQTELKDQENGQQVKEEV